MNFINITLTKFPLHKITLLLVSSLLIGSSVFAQQSRDLQYFRAPDKTGLNVFETPKDNNVPFKGFEFRIGGSNTLQFQGIGHSNSGAVELAKIGPNFNLATSNLAFDVQLDDGVRMHLSTYLTSRHHTETYVKGGYLQVDKLNFIQEDFLAGIMDKVTIKVGHMQNNYGDAHLRRSDNGQSIYNPFVGNYIMDSFTTEVGGEVYYQSNGLVAMVGVTNGKLNQSVIDTDVMTKPSFLGKLGYDSQLNEDLRVRLTGSIYTTSQSSGNTLYSGDRAGSRYYGVMEGSFRSGHFNPGFSHEVTSIMVNPFVKFQGLEFFGVLETSSGKAIAEPDTRTVNQYGAELLYRIGQNENYYVGGRYNSVAGDLATGEEVDITRFNIGGGWFLNNNILTKVEYVNQNYNGFSGLLDEAKFSGMMLEAVISF
ncbi:MAG: hypothetical protein WD267_11055 [Balneolales bacterium]